jgi:UDP-3-O-[3-hydroxymyristoyl] glucosamine N-acyltransferase
MNSNVGQITLETLINAVNGLVLQGDGAASIFGLAPLDKANKGELSFLANTLYLKQIPNSSATAIIISPRDLETFSSQYPEHQERNWLLSSNPYASFARIAQFFAQRAETPRLPTISPQAHIAQDVEIPSSAYIGPGVVIESGVKIGERVVLMANTFIGHRAVIGDDSKIYPQTSIYHHCSIGKRCIIHSGAVIGADGFGFAPDFSATHNEWVKIPQVGGVVIGDDVEIGANTTIDRGAMANTRIDSGTKLDNQIQVGHNTHIGSHCVIAGNTAIAGSVKIGNGCMIGGQSCIAGHLTIADRVTISGGTSIMKSISKSGHYTSVFPLMPHTDWEKTAATLKGITKLRERIRHLESEIEVLSKSSV